MSAMANSIEVNLKHIKEMNEVLDSTCFTLDTQTGKLKESEAVQKAAYDAE